MNEVDPALWKLIMMMMILRMLMIMRRMIMRVTAMVVTYKTAAAEASHQEAYIPIYQMRTCIIRRWRCVNRKLAVTTSAVSQSPFLRNATAVARAERVELQAVSMVREGPCVPRKNPIRSARDDSRTPLWKRTESHTERDSEAHISAQAGRFENREGHAYYTPGGWQGPCVRILT
jgi:hypothetical protein